MSPAVILSYLMSMNEHAASDLYITVGHPPALRVDDVLVNINDAPLTLEAVNNIIGSTLTPRQKREYERNQELNTALDMGEHGRFRVNVFRQRQAPGLVIRRITSKIPSFEELRLPKMLETLSLDKRGLILITGVTGSGKSTTLASMIDYRNMNVGGHIISIEDPIEYYHDHKKSVITQREVGVDTESYAVALKNALRQRPDVILVGEIRDREVMEQVLIGTETGHLCLSTIHTTNAYQAIERIVNLFPDEYAKQVRLNLSLNLKAIISQRLVPCLQGGVVPAVEVMINQGLVRELILKGEIGKIQDAMGQNNAIGMRTFEQSLMALYSEGVISEETVLANADKSSDTKVKMQQVKLKAMKDVSAGRDALHVMDTSVISLKD